MNRKGFMPVNSEIGAVAPSQRGVGGDSLTPMVDTKPKRLLSPAALTFLALWYLTSLSTLFLNKHILSTLQGNPQSLAVAQMTTTCVMGAAKVYGGRLWDAMKGQTPRSDAIAKSKLDPNSVGKPSTSSPTFVRDMILVGIMRFSTVMLGLVSLNFVPVSFTETIKSSAPFFTVLFAWLILGEKTSGLVKLSLVPIAGGLALASAVELSFNAIGFFAALANNGVDCIQNVFSKKLLMGRYSYVELQFYTSAAALLVQIPLWIVWYYDTILSFIFSAGSSGADTLSHGMSGGYVVVLLADATSYHLQSVFAYALMDLISPVTHSVANTVKRAVLIWLSVLFFGNPVSWLSVVGTCAVVGGVFVYNWAREREHADKRSPSALREVLSPGSSPSDVKDYDPGSPVIEHSLSSVGSKGMSPSVANTVYRSAGSRGHSHLTV